MTTRRTNGLCASSASRGRITWLNHVVTNQNQSESLTGKSMRTLKPLAVIAAVSTLCLTSTSFVRGAEHDDKAHGEAWAAVKQAVAVLHATAGNKCHGTVRFTQEGDSVKVVADIEGLTPGQKHAFHI